MHTDREHILRGLHKRATQRKEAKGQNPEKGLLPGEGVPRHVGEGGLGSGESMTGTLAPTLCQELGEQVEQQPSLGQIGSMHPGRHAGRGIESASRAP